MAVLMRQVALAAVRLASLGAGAVAALEAALPSLEAEGVDSVSARNAYWLLVAYAKTKGAAVGPWLDRLRGAPEAVFLLRDVDAAKAVSLGVTSFVSAGRASGRSFPCRDLEPRDTLDRLVPGVLQGALLPGLAFDS